MVEQPRGEQPYEAVPTAVPSASPAPERHLVLWLTNASHAMNHFQLQMVAGLYPLIMADLGFGFLQLGQISAVRHVFNWTQGGYGLVTPFIPRPMILGLGNLTMALGTLLTGFSRSFWTFLGARSLTQVGSGGQHPVGASLLSSYFPSSRGTVLALNTSIATVGSLLAPTIMGVLVLRVGWRPLYAGVAVIGGLVAIPFFFLRDRLGDRSRAGSGGQKLTQGVTSYLRILRNRNMLLIGLVFMAGGAGQGDLNQNFLAPHFVNDLGIHITLAGFGLSVLQLGAIGGPIGLGWLSDRVSRKGIIQASLILSAVASLWLANQGANVALLALCLLTYGALTTSRGTLTQALVADAMPEADLDAAFSVYFFLGFLAAPFWSLLAGWFMETQGFTMAFSLLSLSYLLAAALMVFVEDKRPTRSNP